MARSKIAHIILIVVSILFAVAMAGGSNQAYFDGEMEQQDRYIVIGLASPVNVYWLGGVVEAFNAETDHMIWARFGLVGKIAWVTAMRALCLIPMVGLAGTIGTEYSCNALYCRYIVRVVGLLQSYCPQRHPACLPRKPLLCLRWTSLLCTLMAFNLNRHCAVRMSLVLSNSRSCTHADS
jgi:hypothetical protein